MKRVLLGAWLVAGLASAGGAVDPFDNWANPDGAFAVAYPLYYGADRLTDASGGTAVSGLDLRLYETILRGVRYFNKDPRRSGLINVLVPVGRQELLGRQDSGLGDPTLTMGMWVVNDPVRHLYLAPGLDVDVPLGSYAKNNPASLGQNVWKFRPLLAFAKFAPPWDVEVTLKYNIATENADTKVRAGNQLQLGGYVGLFLDPKWMLGAHLNWITGADDALSGTDMADSAKRKLQAGPNIIWLVSPRASVMLEVVRDFAARNLPEGTLFLSRLAWKL